MPGLALRHCGCDSAIYATDPPRGTRVLPLRDPSAATNAIRPLSFATEISWNRVTSAVVDGCCAGISLQTREFFTLVRSVNGTRRGSMAKRKSLRNCRVNFSYARVTFYINNFRKSIIYRYVAAHEQRIIYIMLLFCLVVSRFSRYT